MTATAAVMVMLACSPADGPGPSSGASPVLPPSGTGTVEVGGRQVTVHVPDLYDPARPAPLVVALHGYTSDAEELETYLRLTPESERRGFVYAYPDGSTDDRGERFWNATDACCAFGGGVIGRAAYPSAATTVTQWLGHNGCAEAGRNAPNLDLVTDLPAAETSVRTYEQGCARGSTVRAWTIDGGAHVPQLGPAFAPSVVDFLLSQAKSAQ